MIPATKLVSYVRILKEHLDLMSQSDSEVEGCPNTITTYYLVKIASTPVDSDHH